MKKEENGMNSNEINVGRNSLRVFDLKRSIKKKLRLISIRFKATDALIIFTFQHTFFVDHPGDQ